MVVINNSYQYRNFVRQFSICTDMYSLFLRLSMADRWSVTRQQMAATLSFLRKFTFAINLQFHRVFILPSRSFGLYVECIKEQKRVRTEMMFLLICEAKY